MKILSLIWNILKDERGIDPILGSALVMGGSTLLGGLLGKNKTTTHEPFPGYLGLGGDSTGLIKDKMKQPGEQYPGSFDVQQPAVEGAVEQNILGSLANPPTVAGYSKEISDKYKASQISSLKDEAGEQEKIEREMYNRLGLSSSTPWMQRSGELGENKLKGIQEIEARFDYEDIAREIEANKLVQDITNQYLTQGQVLGQSQKASSQYTQGANYSNWLQAQQQPYQWAGLGANVLGSSSTAIQQEPNIWSQLAQGGQDIGRMMIMNNILNPSSLSSGGYSDPTGSYNVGYGKSSYPGGYAPK